MKILTWNLKQNKSSQSWPYAINKLDADIYIFQESFHPLTYLDREEFENNKKYMIWEPTDKGWGNSIITKNLKIKHQVFLHSFKGRIIIGRIQINPKERINVIGLHTPITGSYSRYNLKIMLREIKPFLKYGKAIVAGDINFGACFDKDGKSKHKEFLDNLLDEYKLVNCYKEFHKKEKQTFRPSRKPESMMHLDYIFVTKDISDRIKDCKIIDNKNVREKSDHNPVIAMFE